MLVWAETHAPYKLQKKKSGLFLIGAEQYECRNNGDLILNVTEYHLKTVCDVEYTVTGKLFSSIDGEKEDRERGTGKITGTFSFTGHCTKHHHGTTAWPAFHEYIQLTENENQHSQAPRCWRRTGGGHLSLTARGEVEQSRREQEII